MAKKHYSAPEIRTTDPKKWYVEFYYDVPPILQPYYSRKRARFKKYGDINRVPIEDRMRVAKELQEDWRYSLDVLGYNPFEEEMRVVMNKLTDDLLDSLSPEEQLKMVPVTEAMKYFIQSKEGEVDPKTVTTYQNTVNWLTDYFVEHGIQNLPVSEVTRLHLAGALKKARKDRGWKSNTTYNKEVEFCLGIFNWLEEEEYILKNPGAGKIRKLRTAKKKHKWYDREAAIIAKKAMQRHPMLIKACQFTYWLMIRSKKELRELRVGDIDQTLKRVRYRTELSKNKEEQFRDYDPEFQPVLDEMQLQNYPADYHVFGSNGVPGPKPCAHNTFSKLWAKDRKKAGLSAEYTVYGWKHTRIIHLMMKGYDGYKISYMARHTTVKTTEDYKRDYDYSLVNIYQPEDLTF